jgi:eukaryotic-like serine/threonine-protein kinase
MASSRRGPWSHHRPFGLATILFIVAISGVLSACGPRATRPSSTPSTPVQTSHTVYFFTGQSTGQSGSVDALQSENGSLRWHKQLDKQGSTAVSLLVFGNILYVGRVNEIDALKVSNGTVLWHSNVDGHSGLKVLKVVNGVVYVAVDAGRYVYALRASDGSQLWRYTVSGSCCLDPVVVTDTAIYLGGPDHVDAIKTSDRTLLWHHQSDFPVGIAVVDGVVYVGTGQFNYNGPAKGSLDALRASDGSVLWHSETGIPSVVLTVADGIVYVGALFGSTLDALRVSDGSLLWQYKSERAVLQATVMDGVVYLTSGCGLCSGDNGSTVDALRVSDGSHLWRYTIDPGFSQRGAEHADPQVAVADGMVYVGTLHGIIALDATSGNKRWFHAADNTVFALAVGP